MLIIETKIDLNMFRIYTLELLTTGHYDVQTEVNYRQVDGFKLALIRSTSWTVGAEYLRTTMQYSAKLEPIQLADRLRILDTEAKWIDAWVKEHGKELITWMKRCPFQPKGGVPNHVGEFDLPKKRR